MNDEPTPLEQMDKAIEDLQESAAGELDGLADKVSSSFWDRVKTMFFTIAAAVWLALPNALTALIPKLLTHVAEETQDVRDLTVNEVIERLVDDIDNPQAMLNTLEDLNQQYPTMGWLLSVLNVMIVFGGVVRAHMDTIMMKASQSMMAEKRPSLIPIEPLIEALFKDSTRELEVKEVLNRLGLGDDLQELLKVAGTAVLGPEGLQRAYLRGEIDDSQLRDMLHANRLGDESIDLLKKLYDIIPPVNDIITMAVREVFSPDIVAKFGQMQDFPEEFAKWAKQQGLTEFWAKNYWAAHWSLPSPLQAFEMLHRDVIDSAELDILLRALDIMPYWREKLTAIAYNPLTRVDVRRMFNLGVLDESGVYKAYKDVGYNDTNAELMTDFTKAFVADPERQLTKADILSLFKKRGLTEGEAVQRLIGLGYSEDTAWLLLYRAMFEVESSMKSKAVSSIRKLYVAGKITETEAVAKLASYNMSAAEINQYLEIWDLDRQDKIRNLTTKEIERFYKEDIITAEETMLELRELGYNLQDAQRFMTAFAKGE